MEYVVAIKEIEKIRQIKKRLAEVSPRDHLLFVFGINTGISVHDLLFLKVDDVWDGVEVREFLFLKNEKSGETEAFYLNNQVSRALKSYLSANYMKPTDYLFKSKKSDLPITRQQAYRIINHAVKEAGVEGKFGTHTLRKTFGYHAYQKGVAISILMKIFHHYSRNETLKYIGVEKKENSFVKVDVNL